MFIFKCESMNPDEMDKHLKQEVLNHLVPCERPATLSDLAYCSLDEFLKMRIDAPQISESTRELLNIYVNNWRDILGLEPLTKEEIDKRLCGNFYP